MNSKKSRAFKFFDRIPVVRDTSDPEYAGIFLLFVCAVAGALSVLGRSSSAFTHVLQAAGGVLVVMGVYLTTVSLRSSRSEQYVGRLMTAIGQLNSQSEPVRLGTIRLLEAILVEAPDVNIKDLERVDRYKRAVVEALDAISNPGETNEAALAREVSDAVAKTLSDHPAVVT